MTHTPGPWKLNDTDNLSSWSVQANGSKRICAARWYPRTYEAKAQARDNARLIAAAPELLEALKLLAIAKYKGPAHLTEALWEQAYAAIAKAEGKQ